MKIGDKVFYYDRDRRVYREDSSRPVYQEKFRETEIVGETKTAWLTTGNRKFSKKPKQSKCPEQFTAHHDRLFTRQDVDDAVYVYDHRHRIAERIRDVEDAGFLQEIARLVGYKP